MTLSALLDHLWQSTLLALLAGVAVLALRKGPAAARYGLWFAASAKFLVPFAALAALGRFAARLPALAPHAPAHATPPAVFPEAALIEKAAQPLARFPLTPSPALLQAPSSPAEAGPAAVQAAHHAALRLDPLPILLLIWAAGFAVVLVRWLVRWERVRRALRSARPLDWPAPMPVLAAPTLMEPGLVGFLRPVLVLPESLPERLTRPQIEAILAHEACHLRRRDNLAALVHTLVEAVFWFHPLVWWIGARLIAERERACDEAVVRAGHDRTTYARTLVESARFYLQSPLSCVAGASGSDLKTRVEAIMTAPLSSPLSRPAKALLAAAGACAIATPVAAGLLTPGAQQAITPLARAATAIASPARALAQAPPLAAPVPDSAAAGVMTLAGNKPALAPALTVAGLDASPVALTHSLAAPSISPVQSAASSAAQAVAAPQPREPVDLKAQAANFIHSYVDQGSLTARNYNGDGPRPIFPRFGVARIAFWAKPICIRVVGLPSGQADGVKARIEAVARAAGAAVGRSCPFPNVVVSFTSKPEHALDGVQTISPVPLRYLKAVEADPRPIQVSYLPERMGNGFEFAPATKLEVNLLMAVVIVDTRRTGNTPLAGLTDDAAMLALTEPTLISHCRALPSITDLFADCAGRSPPEGLTAADDAYLQALYTVRADGGASLAEQESAIADRMATILAGTKATKLPATNAKALQPSPVVAAGAQSAVVAADPPQAANLDAQAASFVQGYAATTPKTNLIAVWFNPICVRVVGLAADQAAAVRARVEQVARSVGVGVQPAGCKRSDIEIGFTTEPQRMLDAAVARLHGALGDRTSGTQGVKTVSRPIQAWYLTNGREYAENGVQDLMALVDDEPARRGGPGWAGVKVLVDMQTTSPFLMNQGVPGQIMNGGLPLNSGGQTTLAGPSGPPCCGDLPGPMTAPVLPRQFLNAMVIVDLSKTDGLRLNALADYAAMLALAQPRSAEGCQALSSITDLFDACPGRAKPEGLTQADAAYLTALYATVRDRPALGAPKAAEVAGRMAQLLANTKVASR